MIQIDYEIVRNEVDKTVTYKPDKLPHNFHNVSYIQGPNGCGKSTLLNIIALAFYGNCLPETEIDPTLKNKINSLLTVGRQKIKFRIAIEVPNQKYLLVSEKLDFNTLDIVVRKESESGVEYLSSEKFLREFQLVYDIPYNPLERLPLLINDVRNKQNNYGNQIGSFKDYLDHLLLDISQARDEEALGVMYEAKHALEIRVSTLEEEKLNTINQAKTYFKYGISRLCQEAINEKNKLLNDVKIHEEKKNSLMKDNRRIRTTTTRQRNNYDIKLQNCKSNKAKIDELLRLFITENEKIEYSKFSKAKIENEIIDPLNTKTARYQGKFFLDYCDDSLQNTLKNSAYELNTIELYQTLDRILSNSRYLAITLPGRDQTVEMFINDIRAKLDEFNNFNTTVQKLKYCKELLQEFINQMEDLIEIHKTLKNSTGNNSNGLIDQIDILTAKIENAESEVIECKRKITKYNSVLIENRINPDQINEYYNEIKNSKELHKFLTIPEKEIIKTIDEENAKIKDLNSKITRYKELLAVKTNEISEMENRKPHQYRNCVKNIETLRSIVRKLEYKFRNDFDLTITSVIENRSFKIHNENDQLYVELLGELLAKKLNKIRYNQNEYLVKSLDVVGEKIKLSDIDGNQNDKEILFSYLGTGQSQAAYLQTKLAMTNNKKIIALFDEVAMMDEKSLGLVKEKISELYKNGKLIAAIIAQKNEEFVVEKI